jgi:galactokinase
MQSRVLQVFRTRYGTVPSIAVRAPGRVNLIGEHTDYNDGFVLPMAIDRALWVVLRRRTDRRVVLWSVDYEQAFSFDLDRVEAAATAATEDGWGAYVQGVAGAMQEAGHTLTGWDGVLVGDVPRGAGLSSSAALELAVARAFAAAAELAWDPVAMARLGQRVENEWVGVDSGIMDQLVIASARAGAALLIDCRTLDRTPVPLPEQAAVLVMDTGTRRGLVGSAYNERRRQCEAAAEALGVPALRDVERDAFAARADDLDPVVRCRARHVVTENTRTLEAAEALRAGDVRRVGALMDASHASLRDDFEVSSPALDALVGAAQDHPACYGARMTGAGFGGCAVALVEAQTASDVAEAVSIAYRAQTGHRATVYRCTPSQGVHLVRPGDV